MKSRVAIVAAMAAELRPLVKGWKQESAGEGITVFSSERAIAVFAGIGAQRARLATTAALRFGPIHRIVSAGWAGGLHAGTVPGGVWRVRAIVDAATGSVLKTVPLQGKRELGAVLVTIDRVASAEDKRRMRGVYSADLVDMEGAVVAELAREWQIPFTAIKAVSDGPEFDLPGMERFTDPQGRFHQAAFAAYVALRPVFWGPVVRLARDSGRAARNLGWELERYLVEEEGELDLHPAKSAKSS